MKWLLDAVNWALLTLGDVAQWLWHDALGYVGSLFEYVSHLLNPLLAPLTFWLNQVSNPVASIVFAPIALTPGWVSNTLISAVTGVLLLIIFKYTSNQRAIARVKDRIKADLLAAKLFKDEIRVTLQAQARLFGGAFCLLRYSLRPLAVMIVPVSLQLAQMGLWYQHRPLQLGEEALVTVQLASDRMTSMPAIAMEASPAAEVLLGPVRIQNNREILFKIRAREPGRHQLVFTADKVKVEKELVIGQGFKAVSTVRPGWTWTSILMHPIEHPLTQVERPFQSISIQYPPRPTWASGADTWVIYFFLASLVAAFIFKPLLKVKI